MTKPQAIKIIKIILADPPALNLTRWHTQNAAKIERINDVLKLIEEKL